MSDEMWTPPSAQPRPARPPQAPALSRAQLQRMDWSEPEPAQLPAVRTSYVPAASDIIQMPRVDMASPDANINAAIQPFATIEGKTLGSHADRARAWIRYAMPLCGGVAVVATIMAWTLANVPILSFWSLLVFGLSFVLSYTVLLLNYWRHTPEGVALSSTRGLWDYLRTEQAHRHSIEREAWELQRKRMEDRHVR